MYDLSGRGMVVLNSPTSQGWARSADEFPGSTLFDCFEVSGVRSGFVDLPWIRTWTFGRDRTNFVGLVVMILAKIPTNSYQLFIRLALPRVLSSRSFDYTILESGPYAPALWIRCLQLKTIKSQQINSSKQQLLRPVVSAPTSQLAHSGDIRIDGHFLVVRSGSDTE